ARIHGKDVRPLLPFFTVGLSLALFTAWLERTMVRAAGEDWSLTLPGRLVLAGRSVAFYAGKIGWPASLSFIYPRWRIDPAALAQGIPFVVALAALVSAWALRARIGRGPLAALLLFGGVLFPAMGFFNVYAMRFSYVADHFAYQAVAVACAAVACGAASLLSSRPRWKRAAALFGAALLVTLGAATWNRTRVYHDPESLWKDQLPKNPACYMCLTNYGDWLVNNDRAEEAASYLEASLKLKISVPTLLNLSRVEDFRGHYDAAASYLRKARDLEPADTLVLINLATMETK